MQSSRQSAIRVCRFLRSTAPLTTTLILAATLTGCGPFLSESGPGRQAVLTHAATSSPPTVQPLAYHLVKIDTASLPGLTMRAPEPKFDFVSTGVESAGTIGIGDDIGITIFEAAPGGLFITDHPENQSGNSVTLPTQQVDRTGMIIVPYGGAIPVVGRTPASVQQAIERKLSGRALEPQVVVSILNRRSGMINVVGDVSGAARFSLDPGGETLLGAVARAGGPRFADYETIVTLHRRGVVEKARLSEVVEQPEQNVELEPGDTVYVSHQPQFFLAMGATGQATSLGPLDRRIAFGGARITLADALAKAGGLEDDRANAMACFVYRLDHRRDDQLQTVIPTVYLADLRDPAGYFYASQFVMHPEDVIFVSNAPETDLAKFLSLVLPTAYSASGFNSGFK